MYSRQIQLHEILHQTEGILFELDSAQTGYELQQIAVNFQLRRSH
ncbi:hypothetical protein [Sphaerotilus uruguayifluvii]|uniref:Uncharacterized protein n=1 Tax=Sphaerotilus uruguayifluvii TaxID=2735897 RepID=A0ABX2G1D6_9BURK|nr:hypothetical protein [Leptothrix sp. C29]NRT56111.1 hypothetical protein [Leptothrix sp. C29]